MSLMKRVSLFGGTNQSEGEEKNVAKCTVYVIKTRILITTKQPSTYNTLLFLPLSSISLFFQSHFSRCLAQNVSPDHAKINATKASTNKAQARWSKMKSVEKDTTQNQHIIKNPLIAHRTFTTTSLYRPIVSSQIHNTVNLPQVKIYKMKLLSIIASLPLTAAFAPNSAFGNTRLSTELDATIQFVKGLDEKTVPNVNLTRAKDGSSGVATFQFDNPNCFDASTAEKGEVTGMFLIDEEGDMMSTDVNAKFANGKPQSIEATYVMKSPAEWDRFMRFMERYAEANGLGFTGAK